MTGRNPFFQTHVAEYSILLLIVSSHAFFLPYLLVQRIVSFSALCKADRCRHLSTRLKACPFKAGPTNHETAIAATTRPQERAGGSLACLPRNSSGMPANPDGWTGKVF